jgi:hypothetical protein
MATIWDTWATDPKYGRVVNDPRFTPATALFKNKIHDTLFKYGFGSPGDAYGVGPVENNPYSVANMLTRGRTEADRGTYNDVNAAGLEESGAAVGALNANNENYKHGVADALMQQGQDISGTLGDYNQTIGDIFGSLEADPIAPPPEAAPPPPPPAPAPLPVGQPIGVGTNTPIPQVPYQRTGPEAGSAPAKLPQGSTNPIMWFK